ncbi:hypothetical protein [Embleya sp. NPDC005575]|uniref:hypothetical protein n=1 Tax=Embleya sp. NPDC005575 TaxID=3156892 RepID=UPI0033A29481
MGARSRHDCDGPTDDTGTLLLGWVAACGGAEDSAPGCAVHLGEVLVVWRTRAQSVYVRDPGRPARTVDNYAVTGVPYRPSEPSPRPLTPSLDAAAPITGRDVAAADRAFAGVRECAHCGCAA